MADWKQQMCVALTEEQKGRVNTEPSTETSMYSHWD